MDIKSLIQEFKRRNIYKVAATYALTGWIIIQIATNVFPMLEFPQWTSQFVIILVLIGFPIALVFTWAFEITPDGIKRTQKSSVGSMVNKKSGSSIYWIAGLLTIALILLLAERFWWAGTYNNTTSFIDNSEQINQKSSIAVLPFEDYSPAGNQQWFSDGLTEEILNSLSRLEELKVPARKSSFMFRNKDIPVSEIADSLQVNHLLEGSVRRMKEEMRITVKLIRAENGSQLWSKTYNRSVNDVFEVQKDIATQVANTLDIYLDKEKRKHMFSIGTQDVNAYEAYLRGISISQKAHLNWLLKSLWEANNWYEQAYRLDSTFAAPYFKHHDVYAHILYKDISDSIDVRSPDTVYKIMHEDYSHAIRYSDNADTRLIYRLNKEYHSQNWDKLPKLINHFRKRPEVIQLNIQMGGTWIPWNLPILGYASLGHQINLKHLHYDPLNDAVKRWDSRAMAILGKSDEALSKYKNFLNANERIKASILTIAGDDKKARALWKRIEPEQTRYPPLNLGWKLLVGLKSMNKQKLESYGRRKEGVPINEYHLVFTYFAAGHPDKANNLAHKVDSSILGPQKLSRLIKQLGNHIPFDLEATPNLAHRFKEAGIETKSDTLADRQVLQIVQKEL